MNNSGAICNVNSTYLGHPCLYDKTSKYAFQQFGQKLLRRHFKGHLSVIWKSCQSPSRSTAAEMAQKIIFTLSLSLSPPLSFRSERPRLQESDKWFTLENGLCSNWEKGGLFSGPRSPPPLYASIKYAIVNVIWAALNVITCDTGSARQAAELKGEFDHLYLTKRSSGLGARKVWPSIEAEWIDTVWFICPTGQTVRRFTWCLKKLLH